MITNELLEVIVRFIEQQEKAQVAIVRALEELDLTVPSFGNHPNLGSECVVVAYYAVDLAMSKKGWVHSNLCTSPIGDQFRPRGQAESTTL